MGNDKITSKPKTLATVAGVVGLFVGLVVGVLALVGYCYHQKRRARVGSHVQLPTISRNASTLAATADVCVSPSGEEATPTSKNPLTDKIESAQIKMEHKKLSKYEEMED